MHRLPRGFTLVELLVVVAIITILMVVLMPALSGARAQAKSVKCAANMRSLTQVANVFATEHDGRGIGGGFRQPGSTYLGWQEILNVEYFNVNNFWPTESMDFRYIQLSGTPKSRAINCPAQGDFVSGITGSSAYFYNYDAKGGPNWFASANGREWGTFGLPQQPSTVSSVYAKLGLTISPNPSMDASKTTGYWLGAKFSSFNSSQIMIWESASSNYYSNSNPGTMVRDNNGFSYKSGAFAFRHPFGRGANFAFFDGHVERLAPMESWNDKTRFVISQ